MAFSNFLIGLILVVMILAVGVFFSTEEETEQPTYQGPVRLSDDLQYFRETGITKTLVEVNG